ncbi:head-tail connector protein [Sphingomonas sp.]
MSEELAATGGPPGGIVLGDSDGRAAMAEVRALLRIGGGGEEALLARLIDEACALAEQFTGQLLIARPIVEAMAGGTRWTRLKATPVRAITGLTRHGEAIPPDRYAIDIDARGDAWVRMLSDGGGVRVALTAGMASGWSDLPAGVRGGIVRLAAHRFAARDDDGAPPAAVAALWRPWRRMRLADRVPV